MLRQGEVGRKHTIMWPYTYSPDQLLIKLILIKMCYFSLVLASDNIQLCNTSCQIRFVSLLCQVSMTLLKSTTKPFVTRFERRGNLEQIINFEYCTAQNITQQRLQNKLWSSNNRWHEAKVVMSTKCIGVISPTGCTEKKYLCVKLPLFWNLITFAKTWSKLGREGVRIILWQWIIILTPLK